jgi:hypothetical protein
MDRAARAARSAFRLTGLDYARAREGHRGSIAEYCDGSKPTRAACALMMLATLRSGRSVDHHGHPIVGCRPLCVLLNLPPQIRHRLARYKTLLNDTLRRWRPIDSRVSAAIDPRCPSRARSQGRQVMAGRSSSSSCNLPTTNSNLRRSLPTSLPHILRSRCNRRSL